MSDPYVLEHLIERSGTAFARVEKAAQELPEEFHTNNRHYRGFVLVQTYFGQAEFPKTTRLLPVVFSENSRIGIVEADAVCLDLTLSNGVWRPKDGAFAIKIHHELPKNGMFSTPASYMEGEGSRPPTLRPARAVLETYKV